MGCASSKIDDLPAVALCRERLEFLNQALHLRHSLTDSHVAYIHSLSSVGISLHRFFDSATTLPPPIVTTTKHSSTTTTDAVAPASQHLPRSSSSGHSAGSHLHFHSDDSDDDHSHLHRHSHSHGGHIDDGSDSGSELGSLHHDVPSSPPRMMMYEPEPEPKPGPFPYNPYMNPYGYQNPYPFVNNPNVQMNFMRRHVTPSVSYEHRPGVSSETVHHYGDPMQQPPSSSYYQVFNNNNNNPYDYFGGVGGGGGGGGNYGNPYGYGNNYGGPPAGGGAVGGGASTSKQPPAPPPPPPPPTSAWDFLNPFESIDSVYPPPYTPSSRDSREVREEEGIPELEDEDFQHEVVKEVHGRQKLVDEGYNGHRRSVGGASSSGGERKSDVRKGEVEVEDDDEDEEEEEGEEVVAARASAVGREERHPVEYEVHMVDKKVVGVGDDGKVGGEQVKGSGGGGGFKNVFEVVKEIQIQFERAASAGDHLNKVLEVGKLRYQRKTPAFQVSTKMLNVITPSLPSSSRDSEATTVDLDEEVQIRSLNLSASLQKLYLWEKKLYEEVKSEEKLSVLHDRKLRKLKQQDERGAEPQKVESTRSAVRSLSTKIRIAIQIVDRLSDKINKVRDGELWPQLHELIQGLNRMWKAMLECHQSQCQAIDGARGLDAIAFPDNPSDTHLEATLQLEHDLINWTCRFTEWVGTQKGFVRALKNWLFKCINDDPEETADGYAPFSPGRAGAPMIFVICHQWNQSLERISETSEKEVINSMRVFAMMVWHFRERDKGEMKQRMTANRDIERKVKNLDREDMKIQKEIQALDKKMVIASGTSDGLSLSGHVVYQSDTSSKTSLQAGLRQIFEALDRFTTDSVKAYEELLQRIDEVARERGMVS